MRARLARFPTARSALTVWAAAGLVAITGCGSGDPPPAPQVSQPPVSGAAAGAAVEPRADLARRVAAAKDRRFTAAYAWTGSGAGPRTVTVTLAADGTWRVDIPGGAEGGRSGVSLVGRAEGVYQCTTNGCVRVARAAGTVPSGVDPKVHHPFTDWPAVLADPKAALSVTSAGTLPGVTGTCFSVEPTTVSIAPPIDPGIFCYGDDGMPTGVRTRFGTLALAGPPGAAPATADLAGPVSNAPPLSTSAPPAPSPSGSRR